MKKVLVIVLLLSMVAGIASQLFAQGSGESDQKVVGIAMPTQSSQRWIQDGNFMKEILEGRGYKVDLQYAEDNIDAQVSQLENMIVKGSDVLVIASIDGESLTNVLNQAADNDVKVIAYDRLIKNSPHVSYYATFDNFLVGVQQGGYAGWVLFRGRGSGRKVAIWKLWYHHGYGGGGPVTRGVIDFSRYLVDIDADAVVSGHIHQRTLIEAKRQRLTSQGIPEISPLYLVRSSTYKDESVTDGWAVEKGMSARPMGGWWLCLRFGGRNESQLIGTFHDRPFGGV